MKVRKAIIPAAGLGTRFLPATKAQPKELLPIVDKPAIQYIVGEAIASGIEDILIVSGRGKPAIEDHFDKYWELEEVLAKNRNFSELEQIRAISEMANIHYRCMWLLWLRNLCLAQLLRIMRLWDDIFLLVRFLLSSRIRCRGWVGRFS